MSPGRRGLVFAGFWWGGTGCRFLGSRLLLLLSMEQWFLGCRLSLGRRFRLSGLRLAFVSVLRGGIRFRVGMRESWWIDGGLWWSPDDLRLDKCRHFKVLMCLPERPTLIIELP